MRELVAAVEYCCYPSLLVLKCAGRCARNASVAVGKTRLFDTRNSLR